MKGRSENRRVARLDSIMSQRRRLFSGLQVVPSRWPRTATIDVKPAKAVETSHSARRMSAPSIDQLANRDKKSSTSALNICGTS